MRIALYLRQGREQIILTPDSEAEANILDKLHDGTRVLNIYQGTFYDCAGGWTRQRERPTYSWSYERPKDESTILVLEPASRIEARSDGTPQAVQPEGREPDPKGDAHNPLQSKGD